MILMQWNAFLTSILEMETKPVLEVESIKVRLFCLYLSFWVEKLVCAYINPPTEPQYNGTLQ